MDTVIVGRKGSDSHYVGRPTPLGNPFYMRDESMRDAVCDNYAQWFEEKLRRKDPAVMRQLGILRKALERDGKITLGCYCAPRRCHADTIATYLMKC